MKFNICVAAPITSGGLEQNEEVLKKILDENPEFVELRFDYIEDIQLITPTFVKNLLDLIGSQVQTIFTFREFSEGGQIELGKSQRFKIIQLLIEAHPQYYDIEMKNDRETLQTVINLARENDVKLIYSFHDFEKTPIYDEGVKIIEKFKEELVNNYAVDFISIKKIIFKLIFTAQKFEDNLIPMKICRDLLEKNKYKNVISFCMGELGIFSRIVCVKAGSFLTYASLEEKTAPGQINIKNMREFLQILSDNY